MGTKELALVVAWIMAVKHECYRLQLRGQVLGFHCYQETVLWAQDMRLKENIYPRMVRT